MIPIHIEGQGKLTANVSAYPFGAVIEVVSRPSRLKISSSVARLSLTLPQLRQILAAVEAAQTALPDLTTATPLDYLDSEERGSFLAYLDRLRIAGVDLGAEADRLEVQLGDALRN